MRTKAYPCALLWGLVFLVLPFCASCGCGDDDDDDSGTSADDDSEDDDDSQDDDDDDTTDDDDDTAPPAYLASPADVDEDGEPELVLLSTAHDPVGGDVVRVELYDAATFAFKTASSEFENEVSSYGRLRDFDGDSYAEPWVKYETAIDKADYNTHKVFDGPGLVSVFSSTNEGDYNYYWPWYSILYPLDFNGDGVVDPLMAYSNYDTEHYRAAFYDGTSGYAALWDSGDHPSIRYFPFGASTDINFDGPADFGQAGTGWLLLREEVIMGSNTVTIQVIDPEGNELLSDSSHDMLDGYVDGLVADFTGDGLDEIVQIFFQDAPKKAAPQWGQIQVRTPPDFEVIYDSGQIDYTEYLTQKEFDANADGVKDLMVVARDTTDSSFELLMLDGTNEFAEIFSKSFPAEFDPWEATLYGRQAGAGRYVPASFVEGESEYFLFTDWYDNGGSHPQVRVYLLDPDTGALEQIDSFDEAIISLHGIGDYDADGQMEVLSTCWSLEDLGGDYRYYSGGRILDGPDFDPVYESGEIDDVLLVPYTNADIDFDDVPDPCFATWSLEVGSESFLRFLDGQNGYEEKAAVPKGNGHTLRPLLMNR